MNLTTCLKMTLLVGLCLGLPGCEESDSKLPLPEFSLTESGVYTVKAGRELKISPRLLHADGVAFRWVAEDGRLLSNDSVFLFQEEELGRYFITLIVSNAGGTVSEEFRVDVVELTPPVVSFAQPAGGWRVLLGDTLLLQPDILNKEEARYEWKIGKEVVGTDSIFSYVPQDAGEFEMVFTVVTPDGTAVETVQIEVVDKILPTVRFDREKQTATLNRLIRLAPMLADTLSGTYVWTVDGQEQAAKTPYLDFIPSELKSYAVTLSVTAIGGETAAAITLEVVTPGRYYRPATAASQATLDKVYEFLPAPGQFVNAGYTAHTMAEAVAYAQDIFEHNNYLSLGAWGGYVVVGFDHSVDNADNEYDFAIEGNSFSNSSEPGIVFVMQDENGNGLPDDSWYELKGSEFNEPTTIRDYAVTYYRPRAAGMDVKWVDNRGKSGTVDANNSHPQMYYPLWVAESSYTLRGTLIKSKVILDGGIWKPQDFEWGYADNYGSDLVQPRNRFKIDNAVDAQGNPIHLDYIDFVKVQGGVQDKGGPIGEVSTEVLGFTDLNL